MKYILNEMLAHITLSSHPNPKNVLIIGSNEGLQREVEKHYVDITILDGDVYDFLSKKEDNSFDVVIASSLDEDELIFAQINRVLNDKGILTINLNKYYYKDIKSINQSLKNAGKNFIIAMPFSFVNNTALFCSKKYHPTADIILQKSDLLENLRYYNSEIHLAAFVLPTEIKKSIINVLKH